MSQREQRVEDLFPPGRIAAEWGLDRATVEAWLSAATVRHFARGSSIYPQGTHRGSIFVVLAGAVSQSVLLPHGQRILCALNRPGALFGFPVVDVERPRWSAADAFTAAAVGILPRREFERGLAALPPNVVLRFFNRVLERQARLSMRLVHCVALDVRGRLALTLRELAAAFGVQHADRMRIDLPLTHESLAEMVGASRERVSRAMAGLMAEGAIEYRRGAISVADRRGLDAACTPRE